MFFFDTYAIIEILKGNLSYYQYHHETTVTSILNLGELYYYFFKESTKETAKAKIDNFKPNMVEFDQELMQKAMLFRYTHKSKKLSMVDCVGYVLSQKLGIPFLTGDQAFENMKGVEFVK